MTRRSEIARRFGNAAAHYEDTATLQRTVAHGLIRRIALACAKPPRAILEIGCGTGLLTRMLRAQFPEALIVATDIAPAMLAACGRAMAGDPRLLLLAMDGQAAAVAGGFDLVCSSLALQWFDDQAEPARRLCPLVAPDGTLQVATLLSGSLSGWQAACAAENVASRTPVYAELADLRAAGPVCWRVQTVAIPYADGLSMLRSLRSIGADLGRSDRPPLGAGTLRRVLRRFEAGGAVADYEVGFGAWTRPKRPGVFVTGTDTEIGKTLVSACLVKAWEADYWKPLQTGLDDDPGDTSTVRRLTGCAESRTHPPALALRAPLSPEDAAAREGIRFDPLALQVPAGDAVLVVEGAGGALVPLDGTTLTAALIARFGLPVVLVARSTLGTINHTLLTIEALRLRGIAILGVVLNGPVSPGNRAAIERHGAVRVIAEIPRLDDPGPAEIARCAALFPSYAALMCAGGD